MRDRAITLILGVVWPCAVLGQTPDDARAIIEKLAPGQSARIGEVTFTLNQKLAGSPDKDGWYLARAARGGFRVRMPVPYNDLTMVTLATDGATVIIDTLGGRSAEGARFLANCTRRSDGKVDPEWAAGMADSLSKDAPGAQRVPVKRSGLTGVELRISRQSHSLFLGQFVSGYGTICQVSVEYSGADMAAVESAARVFLDSFAIIPVPAQ